jgi:hypothetical protein
VPLDEEGGPDGQEPLDGDGDGRVAGAGQADLHWKVVSQADDRGNIFAEKMEEKVAKNGEKMAKKWRKMA